MGNSTEAIYKLINEAREEGRNIVVIPSGDYDGTLEIDWSITLTTEDMVKDFKISGKRPTIVSTEATAAVTINAENVSIIGIDIDGAAADKGILIKKSGAFVSNCRVRAKKVGIEVASKKVANTKLFDNGVSTEGSVGYKLSGPQPVLVISPPYSRKFDNHHHPTHNPADCGSSNQPDGIGVLFIDASYGVAQYTVTNDCCYGFYFKDSDDCRAYGPIVNNSCIMGVLFCDSTRNCVFGLQSNNPPPKWAKCEGSSSLNCVNGVWIC